MKTKFLFAALFLFAVIGITAQEAKYEIKSGIIKSTSDMGQGSESILYFDDYGKKEATVASRPNRDGGTVKMRTITKDGQRISINLDEKTASSFPMRESINYLKLTQEVKDRNKIKELGDETVAGKPCKKYSLEVANRMGGGDQTSTMTVWIWKGITLKSTSSFGERTMTSTATEIQENATVAADLFTVPSGITVEERQRGGGR